MSTTASPKSADPLSPARLRNPVGAHVPVAGGLATTGLAYARRVGAEVVQVFVANPRGWAEPAGLAAQDQSFREICQARATRVFVHAPYLINFCSSDQLTVARSGAALRHSVLRGRAIGAEGVVVHTGSATGGGTREQALAQVRAGILPLLAELDALGEDSPWVLLEPTAGQGSSLCSMVEDLGPYLDALDRHPKVGVCLDTCHAFAAGHDLAAPGGLRRTLDLLVKVAGAGRLRLLHANDSKDVVGAHKDRHENIGAGHIGAAPFRELFIHPATAGVPLVIETPGREQSDVADLARLRALREGQASTEVDASARVNVG